MMQNHSAQPGAKATQTTQCRAATRPSGFRAIIARCLAVLALAGVGAGAVALGAGRAGGAIINVPSLDFFMVGGSTQSLSTDNVLYDNGGAPEAGVNYHLGRFKNLDGGGYACVTALKNVDMGGFRSNLYGSAIIDPLNSDPMKLWIGEHGDFALGIKDYNKDGIGTLDDVTGVWTLGSDDVAYPLNALEFNGSVGDMTQTPVGDTDSAFWCNTNFVPEPMTVGFMAVGALAVFARKRAARSAVRGAGKKP